MIFAQMPLLIRSYHRTQFFKIFAYCCVYVQTMILIYLWVLASLNGNRVLVTINEAGEMIPELFMWIVFVPFVTYGLYHNLRDFWLMRRWLRKKMAKKFGNTPVLRYFVKQEVEWL